MAQPSSWSVGSRPLDGDVEPARPVIDLSAAGPAEVAIDGALRRIPLDAFEPVDVTRVPASTLVQVLDTGAFGIDGIDRLTSRSGSEALAATVDGWWVVCSLHEQPGHQHLAVEATLPWSDDTARLQPARYARLEIPLLLPEPGRDDYHGLVVGDLPAEFAATWPFEIDADFSAADARLTPAAASLDFVPATGRYGKQLHGIVVTDRVVEILTEGGAHELPVIEARHGGGRVELRYLNLPVRLPFDFARSTFVVEDWDAPPEAATDRRLGAGAFESEAAFLAANAEIEYPRALNLGVKVLDATPPIVNLFGEGHLVRADIGERLRAAGASGCELDPAGPMTLRSV